jgi:protein phosphatase
LNSSTGTNEGLTRKGSTNEDSQFSLELNRFFENRREAFGFYMVADGMGGQAAGEVASRMAIEAISAIILNELAGPWMSGEAIKRVHVEKVLHEAILTAHARLREYNQREMRDAGTTLTACCIVEDWAVFANVGDSRTYLFRQPAPPDVDTQPLKTMEEITDPGNRATVKLNERDRATDPLVTQSNPVSPADNQAASSRLIVERVTRDQSLVQNLVDQGELTIEDVYTDPRRNVILYALGAPDDNLPVDLYYRDLQIGDTVLLCSDGLWEMVRDKEIVDILVVLENLQECNRNLISLANQNGGADNISVILVRVEKD